MTLHYLRFDLCNCTRDKGDFCKRPNGSRPEINLEDYINFEFLTTYELPLHSILACFLAIILLYLGLEFCCSEPVNFQDFVLGPAVEGEELDLVCL